MLANRAVAWIWALVCASVVGGSRASAEDHRYLYVATPGIRDYLEYGGHGLIVFDIDDGHKFVKRIKSSGVDAAGKPLNVKGVCASAPHGRVYISTTQTMACYDLVSEKLIWERPYEDGCDRMSIAPDGQVIYLPSFEKDHWNVVDAVDGHVITKVVPKSGSHNTVYGIDGKHAYLAGLKSPLLTVTDASTHLIASTVGPFSAAIRPFTVNGAQTHCYVNVNGLLGFEVGDLKSKRMQHRVEVQGFKPGPVKRHGCPSHGIGLTPDEKELWVVDGYNQRIHIFDNTVMPPKQVVSLKVRDEPGWITFSIDGRLAYPSTGEVIDVATRKTLTTLSDERGGVVMSEKMLEIDFRDGKPFRNGDQFGLGKLVGH
jgi:DNA-binding beta-propeller fold protein YncE